MPGENPRLSAVLTDSFRMGIEHWVQATLRKFSLRIEPATSEVKGERSDHCAIGSKIRAHGSE